MFIGHTKIVTRDGLKKISDFEEGSCITVKSLNDNRAHFLDSHMSGSKEKVFWAKAKIIKLNKCPIYKIILSKIDIDYEIYCDLNTSFRVVGQECQYSFAGIHDCKSDCVNAWFKFGCIVHLKYTLTDELYKNDTIPFIENDRSEVNFKFKSIEKTSLVEDCYSLEVECPYNFILEHGVNVNSYWQKV